MHDQWKDIIEGDIKQDCEYTSRVAFSSCTIVGISHKINIGSQDELVHVKIQLHVHHR